MMIRPWGSLRNDVDCARLETFLEHSIKTTNIIMVSFSWHLLFFSSFSFYFSLSHTCTLCKVEVFILVKHEGTRRRWGSIPLSLYYSTIVYLSICFFLSLHVIEIFMLLKHEGARRSWSSTPILSIIRPLPAFPPCLLVSIDLCLTLRPLFILPFQHHYNQKSFPFCH